MSKTVINSDKAPAAIGTYSQAIKAGNTVYMSGQIPLDPVSMELVEGFEAQTVQVFNYRHERTIGAIAFAVPGLSAALDGMRNQQRFTLSLDGKPVMTLAWTDAAPVIQQHQQCAK